MRRWVWRVLLIVAAMAALTVGASAQVVTVENVKYETDTGTVVGPAKNGITSANIKAEIPVGGVTVQIKKIASKAFENCSTLTSATIPSGITSIGDGAFAASGLRTVTIPGTVTTINPNTFESCTNLNEVTFSENLTSISENAFNGCSNLEKIHFPETMTAIETGAFAACTRLKSVALPEGYSPVKTGTFAGCINLTSVYIPGNITAIEVNAFSGCSRLKILHYGGTDATALTQNDAVKKDVHLVLPVTTVTRQPTCEEWGRQSTSITCDSCNGQTVYNETRTIEKKPHTEEEIPTVPASCTSTGSSGGKRCSVCRAVLVKPKTDPMTPHTETAIPELLPSCTATGSTGGKKCSVCGEILEQPTVVEKLEHETDDDHKDTEGKVTKEPTCTEKGEKTYLDTCIHCNQAVVERKEELATVSHDYTKKQTKPFVVREETCKYSGLSVPHYICDLCGALKECTDCDDIKEAIKDGAELSESQRTHLETHGTVTETEALKHTPKEKVEDPDNTIHGDCLTDGKIVYKETTCTVCGEKFTPDPEETKASGAHTWKDDPEHPEKIIEDATCTKSGKKLTKGQKCSVCGATTAPLEEIIPQKAHTWSAPQPDPDPKNEEGEKEEDRAPTCGQPGVSHVIVTCKVCGITQHQRIELPATGQHKWGEWTGKEPTATQPGEKKRTCETCGKEDKIVLPATGDSKPDDPDKPDEPEKPKDYQVTIIQGAGGEASANRTTAQKGDRITVTVSPNSGYVVDMVRVITADGKVPEITDLGGGRYRFTMPGANTEIRATFEREDSGPSWSAAPEDGSNGDPRRTKDVMPTQNPTLDSPWADASRQLFQDVPLSHWAAGEINWANQMGYMNGAGGSFNPDGAITHQQMWMVLARLTGSNPAGMEDARRWAVQSGFADGFSPTVAVKRHQLVTALYRCARLLGSANRNTTSLAGYTDSRTVPAAARDAFSWALANGIVSGSADKALNPNGTLTRAQFAVILYRYSQRI